MRLFLARPSNEECLVRPAKTILLSIGNIAHFKRKMYLVCCLMYRRLTCIWIWSKSI